jgi:chlorobactene glucosyltransferase
MFFRKEVYWEMGGHAGVRGHLVEDVALGRAVAARMREGMHLVNCDAGGLSRCRMYRTFGEVWEGFSKNARPVFEGAAGGFWTMGMIHFGTYVLPFFLVLSSGWSGALAWWEVGVIYGLRIAAAWRFGSSWLGVVLHPLGYGLGLLIGLNSWLWSWRGRLRWKGRVYRESRVNNGGS